MLIIRLIVGALLLYFLYRLMRLLFFTPDRESHYTPLYSAPAGNEGEDLVEDPYCHTYLPISSAYSLDFEGKRYYFCSLNCLENFRKLRNL